MKGRRLASVALVVLMAVSARAQVRISIYGPGSSAYPIAVMPLKSLAGDSGGALGAQFATMLSRDLDLSGYFTLVDPARFIEDPQRSGITAGEIDFVGWSALGAQALVKGGVSVAGDQVTIEVRLFDVAARQEIGSASKRFTGGKAIVPRMAHKMADAILEALTGERGPFDSQIALISTRGGPLKDLYTYTFERTAPVRVTSERTVMLAPSWRSDLRSILITSYRDHYPHLFEVDLGTKRARRFGPGGGSWVDAQWSPDGSRILATREDAGNSDIYLLDRAGAVIRRLTDHWAIDVSPAWAPDGRRFVFCSARSGAPHIYVMDVDGAAPRRVSSVGNYNTQPAWSPVGDRIAYSTRAGGGFQVVVGSAAGGGGTTITRAGSHEHPSWSPDGRYLVVSAALPGGRRLVMLDRDGKAAKELTTRGGDDTSPSWSRRME